MVGRRLKKGNHRVYAIENLCDRKLRPKASEREIFRDAALHPSDFILGQHNFCCLTRFLPGMNRSHKTTRNDQTKYCLTFRFRINTGHKGRNSPFEFQNRCRLDCVSLVINRNFPGHTVEIFGACQFSSQLFARD